MPEDDPLLPAPTPLKLFEEVFILPVSLLFPLSHRSVFFWREGSSITSPDAGDLALGKKAETTLRAASAFYLKPGSLPSASPHASLHRGVSGLVAKLLAAGPHPRPLLQLPCMR